MDQRVEDPNTFLGHDLQILDAEGNDYTETFIRNPDFQFLLVAWDLEKASTKGLQEMVGFAALAESDGYGFIALTSSLQPEIDSVKAALGLNYDFFLADDIALKTMVRANPGLLVLKDGIVIDKWHHNDFPDYQEFKQEYQSLVKPL